MLKKNRLTTATAAAIGSGMLTGLCSFAVLAQGETAIEEVVVTGSRIARKDLTAASPVTVIDREALDITSAVNVTEVLKNLPAVSGNMLTRSTTNGGGEGASNVTLRGLPATATLVLINGRRLATDADSGETIDINMIPISSIERIEVLKDGASAIYGSDAIAGVINVITRRNFEGLEAQLGYGEAAEGDIPTKDASLTYGKPFDKGSILVGVNWSDSEALPSRNRDVSFPTQTPSSAPPWGLWVTSTGDYTLGPGNPVTLPTLADMREFGEDEDYYNYAEVTDAIMAQERKSIWGSGDYAFSDSLRAFFESSWAETQSAYLSAPTPLFTQFEYPTLTVSALNPYNPFGEDLFDARRRLLELGPRKTASTFRNFRFVTGLEGDINENWSWDLVWNYGDTEGTQNNNRIINKTRTQLALGDPALCAAVASQGCVPLNIFGNGEFGAITPEMADWVMDETNENSSTQLQQYQFNVTGSFLELPGGPLGIAAGVEYREEEISFRPDGTTQAFQSIGNTNYKATAGDRDVKEFYMEFLFPVLDRLDIEMAARYSDYSDFGDTTNPKLGVKWRPLANLTLRGTYTEGFRAPSLRELYQGAQENFGFFTDPCADPGNVGVLPGCTQQSDPALFQFLAQEGGNVDLDPEKSESWTAGLVWSPLDNLNFTLDYYNIKTDQAIKTSAQFVIDQNAQGTPGFEDRVLRNVNGDIVVVEALALNLAARETSGWDIAADWAIDSGFGVWTLGLNFNYVDEYKTQADSTAPFVDVVGVFVDDAADGEGSIPEWKGYFNVNWVLGNWMANWRVNYVSELDEQEFIGGDTVNTMDEWITHDVQASYSLDAWNTLITVGVDNLFDKEPPTAETGFNDNMDARTHSLIGAYWYTRLTLRL